MSNSTTVFAGDDRKEQFRYDGESNLGGFAVASLQAAQAVFITENFGLNALVAIKKVNELTIPETVLLNEQIAEGKQYLYFSAEITAAIVDALEKSEHQLNFADRGEQELAKVCTSLRRSGRRLIDNGVKRGWLPYDYFVIALDNTVDWALPDEWKQHVDRVESLYIFDRNAVHHACSLETNYSLVHAENRVILKDNVEETIGEAAYERLRQVAYDYVQVPVESSGLYSTRFIDTYLEKHPKDGRVYHYGNPQADLDEVLESVKEQMKCSIYNARRVKGLPVDSATIAALVEEHFKTPEQAADHVTRAIEEGVLEVISSNSVL